LNVPVDVLEEIGERRVSAYRPVVDIV